VQADFRGASLQGANLNGAWLMGTNFTGAHLAGVKMIADLPGADLSGADFRDAKVGVNIKNQGMGQMRTDLSNANLAGAVLVSALNAEKIVR
jgi:uncharacterized protein YjbI with pentapeptide repeats